MTIRLAVKRSVWFCEHTLKQPEIRKVGGIPLAWFTRAREEEGLDYAESGWLEAHLAIMHLDREGELPDVKKKWGDQYEHDRVFIIVRVTQGERTCFEDEHMEPHEKWSAGNRKTAYVLHIRNHDALEHDIAACRAVLSMTPDEAEQIFEKNLSGVRDSLRVAFEPPPAPPEVLTSLAHLCEGALAVQVGPDGTPEVNEPRGEIAAAIKKMEWVDKVLSSVKIMPQLDGRLTSKDQKGRVALRKQYADPSFWNTFVVAPKDSPRSPANIEEIVRKEWDALSVPANYSPVRELVMKLQSGHPVLPATLVAESYLELVKKLATDDMT